MKLRLNATLRAALIAAVTAVGFTLTQAQAAPVILTGITPDALPTSAGNSGFSWNEDTGDLTSWRLSFTLTEDRTTIADNPLLGTKGNGGTSAGGDLLRILANGSFTLETGGGNITTSAGLITAGGGTATIVLEYVADYNQFGTSLNAGTYSLSVNDGPAQTLTVSNDGNTVFQKGTGSNTRLWTNGKVEKYSNIAITKLDNNIIEADVSLWKGVEGNNAWTSGNFQPEFATGKDVAFDSTGYTTVVVNSDVKAGEVAVSGAAYTFNIESTGTLSVENVSVGDGGSAKLAGEGTYVASNGQQLGMTLSDSWTGTVRVANQTIENGNAAWIENLCRSESWVEFIHVKGFDSKWKGTTAANIKLTSDGSNPAWELSAYATSTSPYTMVATGSWKGDGAFLLAGGAATQSQAAEFQGDISGWTGSIEFNSPGMRRVTFSNKANEVNAAIKKVGGAGAFEVVAGTEV